MDRIRIVGGTPLTGTIAIGGAKNAALALAALRRVAGAQQTDAMLAALTGVTWPGRFEIVRREPPLVLDGAHNPEGAQALAATWRDVYPGRRPVVLFGCLADRDPRSVTACLQDAALGWHTVAPPSPRALAAEESAKAVGGTPHPDADHALDAALADAEARQAPLLCFGSLYLIGQLRGLLRRRGLLR